ncbi:transposase [Virgibacillus oceani]
MTPIFLLYRYFLEPLMDEDTKLISNYFGKKAKIKPGIIVGLHRFGSKVNFNPHAHMLVTMGGVTKKGSGKNMISFLFKYFGSKGRPLF